MYALIFAYVVVAVMVRRALLTDGERERIAGEHSDEQKYQTVSRVRRRIQERMAEDISFLEEYHPTLLQELREITSEEE